MLSAMKEAPLQTLDPHGAKEQVPVDEAMETDNTDINNNQDEADAPVPTEDKEKLSISNEEIEEELTTPRKSFRPSCSLSVDSLIAGMMTSQNGSAVLPDGDPNRSGIGSVSLLGGQLSPILRSSEFGLKFDETNVEHGVKARRAPVPSHTQPTSSEETSKLSDKESAPSQCQEADAHGDSHAEENRASRNNSSVSSGSAREDDILLAQKQAGASAQAFIQGLRGAAHRRKMNLTRSRDSLAAKEKERKEEA